jgi:hypothetical protein
MPVLHINITKPEQTHKIHTLINAQKFILKKAIIKTYPSASGTEIPAFAVSITDAMGANDIISNKSGGRIWLPTKPHYESGDKIGTFDCDFHMEFNSETIPTIFTTKVYKVIDLADLKKDHTPLTQYTEFLTTTATGKGDPYSIDLFFEYDSNHTFF